MTTATKYEDGQFVEARYGIKTGQIIIVVIRYTAEYDGFDIESSINDVQVSLDHALSLDEALDIMNNEFEHYIS